MTDTCIHENCNKLSTQDNYCNDHLFFHKCIQCDSLNKEELDIYSIYSSYNKRNCNGYLIFACNCSDIICRECNQTCFPHAIHKDKSFICEKCYCSLDEYMLNNYSNLDFEIDNSDRKSLRQSYQNILQSELFEFVIDKKYINNTWNNNFDINNPDYFDNYIFIRRKPNKYYDDDQYVNVNHLFYS